MRIKMKRFLCFVLMIFVIAHCTGCTSLYMVFNELYGEDVVAEAESIAYVGFSAEEQIGDFEKKEALEFKQIDCISKEYNNAYFYNLLTENEQIIYNAYIYAMENGYKNILIDDKLTQDAGVLTNILEYLSYDSPLLEQNLRYEFTTFTSNYKVSVLGLYDELATFEGLCIKVYNFQAGQWEKKLEAIDEAKRVVNELPTGLSKKEKAERLYRYVSEEVKYKEYKNLEVMEVRPYLYDALVKKKSHCDGFTNALALLYRVAGIASLEKTYTSGTDEVGHTWNMFEIDGKWYNADAVSDPKEDKREREHRMKRYFAFEDRLQNYVPDKQELYPESKKSLGALTVKRMKNADTNEFVQVITRGVDSKQKCLIVLLDSYDEQQVDTQMQKIANNIQGTVKWFVYSVIEGRTALYIYQ